MKNLFKEDWIEEKADRSDGALDLFLLQTGYEPGSKVTQEKANTIHAFLRALLVAACELCKKNKKHGAEWLAQMRLDYESTMPEQLFLILWVFIDTGIYPGPLKNIE